MILMSGVLIEARNAQHEQYPLARAAYDLLVNAIRANPVAAGEIILYPSVGAWARRTVLACRGQLTVPEAEPSGLCAIAAASAIRCGLTAEIEVPVVNEGVMLPSLGLAQASAQSAHVRAAAGRGRVGSVEIPEDPSQDAHNWLGLRRVHHGRLNVLIDDLDPFRMPSVPTLPGRTFTPLASAREPWERRLLSSWGLLEAHHQTFAEEIAEAVSVVVPETAGGPGVTYSTTSRESFGAIAMSLPVSPAAGAETLIHETQHLKLDAVLDHIALTMPDDGRRYYAPWRNDPRPVNGLLQGTYAYLGVTRFWRRQRMTDQHQEEADVNYALWREATAFAVRTLLSSSLLTSTGREFVGGMDNALRPWQDERVPGPALRRAEQIAESHRTQWESEYGPVIAR